MVKSSSSKILQIPHDSNSGNSSSMASKAGSNGKKQYKGVRMRSWGSWVSEIRAPNQTRIWLGSYSTPEAAARAYDAALLCLKGNTASLNFPSSPPRFHLPDATISPKSIQRIAAAAAANSLATLSPPSPPETSLPSSPSLSSGITIGDSLTTQNMEEETSFNEDSPIDFEAFFQSPRCMDYMLLHPSNSFSGPSQVEDSGEEVDFRLWSFC
ncbi:ethylene-responsive transcription factor [Canna indica]|uniref:Ethylene-responsive transcription factor n=1 Tax=Canna indica TaxID=4628 RepID=A0AAQ3KKS5_9LILI|nr:ethylene-responsive transcription factor [Canna indica]